MLRRTLAALLWLGTAAGAQTPVSSGTGFYINAQGWLATNAHVVEDCGTLHIDQAGTARAVIVHPTLDLALVLAAAEGPVTPLAIRDAPARLVEDIVALGYPLPDQLSADIRATTGTVSSLSGFRGDQDELQISAPIQPGNSGGPVIDETGQVVGVVAAYLRGEERQNVNFAIKATALRDFIDATGLARPNQTPGGVDQAVNATVLLTCTGSPSPAKRPQQPVRSNPDYDIFGGIDLVGFDMDSLPDMSMAACQRACSETPGCVAVTLNTRHDHCFLKSDAVIGLRNEDARSAVLPSVVPRLALSDFTVIADVDSPGGDYARIRQTDYTSCLLECGLDDRCRAFAFVREKRECWLKDQLGPLQEMPGIEFGYR